MEESSRWTTIRAIYTRQKALWLVPGLVYAAFAAWRDEAPHNLQPPLLGDVLTQIPWWAGVIATLVVALIVLFEGAHREIGAAKRPEEPREIKQAVEGSPVAGTVFQSQGPITAAGNIVIGAPTDRKEEPSVHIVPATSSDGKGGFLYVENPGVAERFSIRLRKFVAPRPDQEVRPRWPSGSTDQLIKKGDTAWCQITELEPDKVPISISRGGQLSYPITRKDDLEEETHRRKRGVRVVRFIGEPEDQDIEAKVGQWYSMEVTVFSDTREPVTEVVQYAVARNETLIMGFDDARLPLIEEAHKKQVEELKELIRTLDIEANKEPQIDSERDDC